MADSAGKLICLVIGIVCLVGFFVGSTYLGIHIYNYLNVRSCSLHGNYSRRNLTFDLTFQENIGSPGAYAGTAACAGIMLYLWLHMAGCVHVFCGCYVDDRSNSRDDESVSIISEPVVRRYMIVEI